MSRTDVKWTEDVFHVDEWRPGDLSKGIIRQPGIRTDLVLALTLKIEAARTLQCPPRAGWTLVSLECLRQSVASDLNGLIGLTCSKHPDNYSIQVKHSLVDGIQDTGLLFQASRLTSYTALTPCPD